MLTSLPCLGLGKIILQVLILNSLSISSSLLPSQSLSLPEIVAIADDDTYVNIPGIASAVFDDDIINKVGHLRRNSGQGDSQKMALKHAT